jgi:hypothetical protein
MMDASVFPLTSASGELLLIDPHRKGTFTFPLAVKMGVVMAGISFTGGNMNEISGKLEVLLSTFPQLKSKFTVNKSETEIYVDCSNVLNEQQILQFASLGDCIGICNVSLNTGEISFYQQLQNKISKTFSPSVKDTFRFEDKEDGGGHSNHKIFSATLEEGFFSAGIRKTRTGNSSRTIFTVDNLSAGFVGKIPQVYVGDKNNKHCRDLKMLLTALTHIIPFLVQKDEDGTNESVVSAGFSVNHRMMYAYLTLSFLEELHGQFLQSKRIESPVDYPVIVEVTRSKKNNGDSATISITHELVKID